MATNNKLHNGRSFLGHALIYGFGAVAMQIASVVLIPLYTFYLTPKDFGILEILARSGQILGIVLMAGSFASVTFTFYCQATSETHKGQAAATVTVLLLGSISIGSFVVVLFSKFLSNFLGLEDPWLTSIGIITGLTEGLTIIPMCLMQARTESLQFILAALFSFLLRVSVIFITVAFLDLGVVGILFSSLITSLMVASFLYYREFKRGNFTPNFHLLMPILRFALPFLPSGLCFFILSNSDRFFLMKTASPSELGIYSLACKMASAVVIFGFQPLYKVWSVRLYEVFTRSNSAEIVGIVSSRLLGVVLACGLFLSLFIHEILTILASPDYISASPLVPYLILATILGSGSVLMDGSFYAFRVTRWKPWINFTGMCAACLLNFMLIPHWGPLGACLASIGSSTCIFLLTWHFSQSVHIVIYPYSAIGLTFFSAIIVFIISSFLPLSAIYLVLKLLLFLLWIFLFLYLSGLKFSNFRNFFIHQWSYF